MSGKRYYLSTLSAWQRHASHFSNSHWLALTSSNGADANPDAPIIVLVEADEGAHSTLEDDPAFEPLPHPLAAKPISEAAQKKLAVLGIRNNATTLDVAEALARFHPLLRHRVF